MNASRSLLFALLAAWLLGGCGFQLRGTTQVPAALSPVYVKAAGDSRLRGQLTEILRNGGMNFAAEAGQANTVIRILEERQDDRVTAVNSEGKIIGSELQYRVRFDAVRGDGSELVAPQTIRLAREYVNPEVEVIGKAEEGVLIRQDMVQDMAGRILSRLKAKLF